ncbi:MAG: hypothetical protein ACSHYA_12350 [Opitutaceae bacterium]
MEYLLLIHKNTDSASSEQEWDEFFIAAQRSGMFQGGSQLGESHILGKDLGGLSTEKIGGFMRFETTDFSGLKALLNQHPVVKNGGTVELIEMPKTSE